MLPFVYMLEHVVQAARLRAGATAALHTQQPTFDNYVRAVTTNQFGRYFLNSLFVAVSSTIITVILSALLAYGFARWDFPGRQFLFFTCSAPW